MDGSVAGRSEDYSYLTPSLGSPFSLPSSLGLNILLFRGRGGPEEVDKKNTGSGLMQLSM